MSIEAPVQFAVKVNSPNKVEQRNYTQNPEIPQNYRDFLYLLLREVPNSWLDGPRAIVDWAQAWVEHRQLVLNPIYTDSNVPKGDGSVVVIVPGFMGSEWTYREPVRNLQRLGWQAEVYPVRYGVHIEPTGSMTKHLVDYLKKKKEQSGGKVHVLAHSKGGHVALAAAVLESEDFCDSVDQLISAGSPIPTRVNLAVGAVYLGTQIFFRGNDFRLTRLALDEDALARLASIRMTTLKVRKDPIGDGIYIGAKDEVFEVESSHAGALENPYNLRFIVTRLARPRPVESKDRARILPFQIKAAA